jgi:hypothetical protein
MVAHAHAKFAISFEQTKVWFESHPTYFGTCKFWEFLVIILMKLQDPFKKKVISKVIIFKGKKKRKFMYYFY